jgi:hypothetical protein
MRWVLAVIVVLPAVVLVVGAVRGRVQVRSCCSVDAMHDKRMILGLAQDSPAAQTPALAPEALVARGDRAAS